ncbi:Proteasome maturation factor UMP1 [Tolypocladium ophioglossoides CBS 100239]|uniref:Proteasome maturation factor UMP1 n=1 Tax=Tolypocladium ophioglossoides (strain CBS 100239) TaxID=1163406 RepID=A0A0L0NFT3_TOLOC|nr:Proteasome maturation factor UMP1 [Tolypocladium ophioglossoides CBS 100239]
MMRIVPSHANPSSFSHTHTSSAPSAPGVHDTLRHGVGPSPYDAASAAGPPASSHPLEARLKNWEATQEAIRMESLRRTFGIAEPIRRGMELKIVRDGEWRPMALASGSSLPSVHEDILRGREDMITWEDIFTGEETRGVVGFHDEMEKKLKIQK